MRSDNINRPLKHIELRNIMKEALVNGHFQPGDVVPSQNELSARYGVSHNTVREAVGSLVAEGYLYRIQGKGTFVAEKKQAYLTIGLVIPHLWTSEVKHEVGYDITYIAPIVQAIEEEAKRRHTSVLLRLDNDSHEVERRNLKDLMNLGIDGIIISYIGEDGNMDRLRKVVDAGIPLVLIDRYVESINASFIITNNRYGAYHATKALLDQGFRKVFHFTVAERSTAVNERIAGYQRALDDYGLDMDELLRRTVTPSIDITVTERTAHDLASAVLSDVDGPFAIFAVNAPTLVGAWRAIQEMGIPHDRFALACFDDIPIPMPEDVRVVKVLQPLREMGIRSVQAVIESLSGNRKPQHVVLEPELITYPGIR